jgi:beta-glucanase (GH16 family)
VHQSEEPDTGPAGHEAAPSGRSRLAARPAGPVLVVVLGLVSLILMTALLAGGTASPGSSGTPTQSDGVPVPQSVPTTAPTTTPTTPPMEPAPPPESAAAAPRSITPPTAAPSHATTTVPTTAAPAPTSAASGSDCGGQPTVSVDGQQWQCTFDDEFNGTALDTSEWVVQQTADGGYHSGMECFEDSPSNVSVSGGTLNLTAEQMPSSFLCPGDPPYYTQYTSGMVSTDKLFDQTDGVFEVRAKISGADTQGLQTSFWLYPAQLTYGAWPASGEIDIAELFSQYPTVAIPFVHYNNSANDPDDTNDNCVIGDPSQFHTYAVEWTPQSMTFTYDGQTCLVDHWNAAWPLADPAPFNEPFYICLTQALGIGTNDFMPGATPLPATTSVDWVRVWGPPS